VRERKSFCINLPISIAISKDILRKMATNLMSEPPKYETLAIRLHSCVPVSLPRCNGARSGHKLQATDDDAHCRVDHGDMWTGTLVPGTGKQPEELLGTGNVLVPGIVT